MLPTARRSIARARRLPEVEVHQRNASKIVIVMEGRERRDRRPARRNRDVEGVLSANMVFEQVERFADIGE